MENKIKTGIIGLFTLLAVFGGTLYLTPEQLDNAYFCTATEEIGIFYGGISGTGLTAYPYIENRSNYERCQKVGIKGVWISLVEYAKEQEIDPMLIINKEPKLNLTDNTKIVTINYANGKTYECFFISNYEDNIISSESKCILKGG